MPLADLVGKVFSANFLTGVRQVTPMLSLAADRSGEVRSHGDSLVVGNVGNASPAIANYPAAGAITYTALTADAITLTLSKEKYVAFEFEDIDSAQLNFNLFNAAVADSARAFSQQLTTDFRAVYDGAQALTGSTLITSTLSSVTSPTSADRQKLVLDAYEIIAGLKGKGYEQQPYLLLHPAVWRQLLRFFVIDARSTLATNVAGHVFADAQLTGLFGLDVLVDWNATGKDTLDQSYSYAGIRSLTTHYAAQLSVPESLRSPDRFARRYRALQTYGLDVQQPDTLYNWLVT